MLSHLPISFDDFGIFRTLNTYSVRVILYKRLKEKKNKMETRRRPKRKSVGPFDGHSTEAVIPSMMDRLRATTGVLISRGVGTALNAYRATALKI